MLRLIHGALLAAGLLSCAPSGQMLGAAEQQRAPDVLRVDIAAEDVPTDVPLDPVISEDQAAPTVDSVQVAEPEAVQVAEPTPSIPRSDPISVADEITQAIAQIAPTLAEEIPSPVTARLAGTSLAEVATVPAGRWLAMSGLERTLPGWVVDQETGVSIQIELRPLIGDGIDRISLEALMGLGIDQARLVIVDVYYDAAALRGQN